ncbi:hypothetical protein L249_0145 [Ophiocordyceps polyrhachis-furcata BCC 54312]|uniref:DNA replication regulator SLD2 n=1 Tax=Ophiocordyceps polyrhachis-furcata BCC 54312 TaxID=1330021 RepID=A0A367LD62_9HYPO|nr:hypothetical protein L249_0145 [Ophiocordyceps polyrhachis-furcata BCC 54312]
MNGDLKLQYDVKAKELRAQLKKWENEWAAAHGGSKPGRRDIKDNPDIAEKYKEYARVRDAIAGKVPPPPPPPAKDGRSKRPAQPLPSETPLKRIKHSEDEHLLHTPAISRKLFSPSKVTSLGPTPQRDGQVLGLFDLLVEQELTTPSKRKTDGIRASPSKRGDVQATPSKRIINADDLGRTPTSNSRRRCLTATPSRRETRTPTSKSKIQFETPAFLKRHGGIMTGPGEDQAWDAPAPLKLPRKPLGRSLSEIVAGLRRAEEEALDEDLEALREAEDEEGAKRPVEEKARRRHSLDEEEGSSFDVAVEDDDDLDRNGRPLPVFKKKAPKRTTRRVDIKPTEMKRPRTNGSVHLVGGEEGTDDVDDESGQPDDDDDDDDDDDEKKHQAAKDGESRSRKEKVVKKAVRKVNEIAHANFKRLKLRNSGAKGGPGHNSRFRRRR